MIGDLLRPRHVLVDHPTHAAEARRIAAAMATQAGFDEVSRGKLQITVTELAGNLIAHGKGGSVMLTPWQVEGANHIDVVAVDKGRGIRDLEKAMEAGHSTAGTPGNGLGSVARSARLFDVYSQPNHGTAVFARMESTAGKQDRSERLDLGAASMPLAGEQACGDAYAVNVSSQRSLFMVVDGLGHGPIAQEAADQALAIFQTNLAASPGELMEIIHAGLQATRGAAVAIAELQYHRGLLHYVGVGNIAGMILTEGATRSLVSHNGTVGHQMVRRPGFTYPWEDKSVLIMYSDGLQSRWNIDKYPGLQRKHPSLVAAVLLRDFNRGRDDATVLVVRQRAA